MFNTLAVLCIKWEVFFIIIIIILFFLQIWIKGKNRTPRLFYHPLGSSRVSGPQRFYETKVWGQIAGHSNLDRTIDQRSEHPRSTTPSQQCQSPGSRPTSFSLTRSTLQKPLLSIVLFREPGLCPNTDSRNRICSIGGKRQWTGCQIRHLLPPNAAYQPQPSMCKTPHKNHVYGNYIAMATVKVSQVFLK